MSKKNTKRALLSSVLALVLCLAMLTGTTFAWFTDSVTSGKNQIVAGNLDVELYHTNSYITEEKVDGLTDLFTVEEGKTVLWEPGMVVWENFTVKNAGNLALKYELFINFSNEYKVNGKGLSEALKVAVVAPIAANATRTEVLAAAKATGVSLASFVLPEKLLAGESDTYGIVIYWEPSDNDNDFNMNNANKGEVLSIDLGIVLQATQVDHEKDSFGDDYDAGLVYGDHYATPATLQEIIYAAEPGDIIVLEAGEYDKVVLSQTNGDKKDDITLVGRPGAVVGVLDMHRSSNVTIKNLTFDAAKTAYTVSSFNGNVRTQHANILDLSTGTDSKGNNAGSYNVTIQGCTFTGTANDVENYVPICWYEQRRASGPAHDFTIDNCVFAVDAQQYIGMNYLEGGVVTVTNNTFGGTAYKTYHHVINASQNGCDWNVQNNTIYNWNPTNGVFGSSYSGNTKVTVNVSNNNLQNLRADTVTVLNIKNNSYNASNLELIYKDNTANNGQYEFAANVVVNGNDNLYQMSTVGSNIIPAGTAADLMAALNQAANGDAVILTQDIDLTGTDWNVEMTWQGSGTDIVFDGGNFTITGLECGGKHGGLISKLSTNGNVTIKNLKIKDAVISSATPYASESAGGILIGWLENHGGTITIENITIEGGSVEGYKYSGGLIGYSSSSLPTNVTNCTVSGVTVVNEYAEGASVKGHIGGLSGHHYYGTFTGNTVENVTLVGSTTALRHGALIGSAQANVVIGDGNEVINTTINGTKVTSGTGIGAVDSRTDKSGTVSFS